MLTQAVQEIAKQGSALSGSFTGTFLVDGAILIAAFKAVEAGIKALAKVLGKGGNWKSKPGEASTCRAHGEEIAKLTEFKDNTCDSLKRIEGKVDRILERQ